MRSAVAKSRTVARSSAAVGVSRGGSASPVGSGGGRHATEPPEPPRGRRIRLPDPGALARRDRVTRTADAAEREAEQLPRAPRLPTSRAAPALQARPDERWIESEPLADALEIE